MDATFRMAEKSDTQTLLELMREFYAHEQLPFDEPIAQTGLEKIWADHSVGGVWLIYDGVAAVGYVVLTFAYSLEFHGRTAIIDELFIKSGYRGRGIGKRALQLMEEVCRSMSIAALHLEVGRENTKAQSLYRKAGFQDHDRYLMTKWL